VRLTLPRLYAILDLDILSTRELRPAEVLETWLAAGVRLVQLRAKSWTMGPLLEVAWRLAATAQQADARFLINDRADIARLCGAAGVHLGQDDLSPDDARQLLLPGQVIGLSTHNDAQLRSAIVTTADYIATGPVFETRTKEKPDPVVGLDGVRAASALTREAGRPLVAIGGITLDSAPEIIAAGADSVAVISDLVGHDWRTRATSYLRALA
jgi:thiamine-phosphate pyrophosphorylase